MEANLYLTLTPQACGYIAMVLAAVGLFNWWRTRKLNLPIKLTVTNAGIVLALFVTGWLVKYYAAADVPCPMTYWLAVFMASVSAFLEIPCYGYSKAVKLSSTGEGTRKSPI